MTLFWIISPAPGGDENGPLQVLVSSIDYNEYVGRIAIGRIERGQINQNQEISLCDYHDSSLSQKAKVTAIYQFDGLKRSQVEQACVGDIVAFSGIETSPSATPFATLPRRNRFPL